MGEEGEVFGTFNDERIRFINTMTRIPQRD